MFTTGQSYGQYLAQLRRSRHLTQAQLAETTGISQPNLSAYENDRRSPSIDVFNRIAVACGYQLVAEAGSKRVPLPLPAVGWFPDEDLPPALPGDPTADHPPPPPEDLRERGRLVYEVMQSADAIR